MTHEMETDAELIVRWQVGADDTAVTCLLRRYQSSVYGYLVRLLGHAADAEDAAQETFVRAVKGLARYRERGQFKSWLYRIAYREGMRALRRRGRREASVEDLAHVPEAVDPGPRAPDLLDREERRTVLAEAVERLPPAEKQVVLMRTEMGLTFREIADAMCCPLGTALGRMHSASKKLKRYCEGLEP